MRSMVRCHAWYAGLQWVVGASVRTRAGDVGRSRVTHKLEETKYASICASVYANQAPYMDGGMFNLALFWAGQKRELLVHYSLWMAEVGCAKEASASVEVVFS